MSVTLKRLGINLEYFPRDLEKEAVESLNSLRMEQILQGENLKFNWNHLLQRPELIELNTEKERNSQFQQDLVFDGEEEQEWIYAQTSLFIFSSKSLFRKNIITILKQKHFDYLRLFFAILNIVAYCIFDYHFRVDHHYPNINRVSVGLEVICNVLFGFEMALQIIAQGLLLEKGTYLRNGWNFVNFIAFLTGWSVLYDNSSKQEFLKFCRATRLLRCGRLIYDIPVLRNQMNAFVGSFSKLGAIIILYFEIVDMDLPCPTA